PGGCHCIRSFPGAAQPALSPASCAGRAADIVSQSAPTIFEIGLSEPAILRPWSLPQLSTPGRQCPGAAVWRERSQDAMAGGVIDVLPHARGLSGPYSRGLSSLA